MAPSQRNHGNLLATRQSPQPLDSLLARDIRQLHVHDDHVRRLGSRRNDSRHAAHSLPDRTTGILQDLPKLLAGYWVGIDYQGTPSRP